MPDLEKIQLNKIKPSPYNPRTIDHKELRKLKNSMDEFGIIDPIIINLNNMNIVGGHQRYTVLERDGVKELNMIRIGNIGWAFQDTNLNIPDEDTEKMVNIALNNIKGDWDESQLTKILADLEKREKNFKLTGFDELDLKGMKLDHEVLVNVDELRTASSNLKNTMTENNSEEPVENSEAEGGEELVEEETELLSDIPETDEEYLEELNDSLVRYEDDFDILEVGKCPHCGKDINVEKFVESVTVDKISVADGLEDVDKLEE